MKKIKVPRRPAAKRTFHQLLRAKLNLSSEQARDYERNLVALVSAILFEQGEVEIPGLLTIRAHVRRRRDNYYSDDVPYTKQLSLKARFNGILTQRIRMIGQKFVDRQVKKYTEEYEQYCLDHPRFGINPRFIPKEQYLEVKRRKSQIRSQYISEKAKIIAEVMAEKKAQIG